MKAIEETCPYCDGENTGVQEGWDYCEDCLEVYDEYDIGRAKVWRKEGKCAYCGGDFVEKQVTSRQMAFACNDCDMLRRYYK